MLASPAFNLSETTAAILAGGLGTRLRTAVGDHPKVLAEVKGRPFLAWLLEYLEGSGLKQVVLCTGYKAEEVQRTVGRSFGGLSILHSRESSPMGTGGALRQALPFLRSGRILVLNGDSFCDVNLDSFAAFHSAHRGRASLALAHVEDARRFGRVQLNEEDQITEFSEKENTIGAGWVNAGVYFVDRPLIEALPANTALSLEREVLPMWIPQCIYGFKMAGSFLDIGTPESYAEAQGSLFHAHHTACSVHA